MSISRSTFFETARLRKGVWRKDVGSEIDTPAPMAKDACDPRKRRFRSKMLQWLERLPAGAREGIHARPSPPWFAESPKWGTIKVNMAPEYCSRPVHLCLLNRHN